MEFRTLGKSGLSVSAVGLGCNNFGMTIDEAATDRVVGAAIEAGITLFDTSDNYGNTNSERFLGKALGARRKDVIVATKFGTRHGDGRDQRGGASRDYIIRAVEASLKRLGTDYIDLYQLHRPDADTPLEETMRALDDLLRQGKVRYIGHSNFVGWQTADAAWLAATKGLTPFISAQNHYSLLSRGIETELVPAAQAHGLSILPYFPLESGLLTGKYKLGEKPAEGTRWSKWLGKNLADNFFSDQRLEQAAKLEKLANAGGHVMLDLAIGWLLSKPYVGSVIAGATRVEQIEQNVKAAAWRPTEEEKIEMEKMTAPPKPLF